MSFSAIFAQERAVRVLRGLLGSRRLPPALLFSGPPGVGKKMAALELAKALDCEAQGEEACDDCPSCLQADKGIRLAGFRPAEDLGLFLQACTLDRFEESGLS